MSSKEILVKYGTEDASGYSFERGEGTVVLKRSNYADKWNLENCSDYNLEDTENGLIIKFDRKTIKLDYSQAFDLQLLLQIYHEKALKIFTVEKL
jgi:hypothetical protein